MAVIGDTNLVSLSDANEVGVIALVRKADQGRDQIILREGQPVAVVMNAERFERLQQLEEDLIDLTLAASRMMTTGPNRYSLDEVLKQFGYSREDLRNSAT